MAKNQVAILHGWSDTSDSFKPLARFLKSAGFNTVGVWLGDYNSLDDDVKIEDVAKRMEAVISEHLAKGTLKAPFDLVVHSTGGLVARRWLVEYYSERNRTPPLQRLVMLAPANHGSQLASMGRSMIGRVFKGWSNGFQTGTHMLNSLELSSPFQWDLVGRDILGAGKAVYGWGDGLVAPFVVTGTHPYTNIRKLVSERGGTDGTVRVAAANMNAHGAIIDFSSMEDGEQGREPKMTLVRKRHGATEFPLAVLADRTHASIVNPADDKDSDPSVSKDADIRGQLGTCILDALACGSAADYQGLVTAWGPGGDGGLGISETTARFTGDADARKRVFGSGDDDIARYFHQYFQVNVSVVDDHGDPVPDFFLEFFGGQRLAGPAKLFHEEVLEDVHTNKLDPSKRTLFIDRYDLLNRFYGKDGQSPQNLQATVSAAGPGPNVSYFGHSTMTAKGEFTAHRANPTRREPRFLKRNCTHYVTIVIPRVPNKDVFKLFQA